MSLHNEWPLNQSQVKFWLAAYNIGFFVLTLVYAYGLGIAQPLVAQGVMYLTVMALLGVAGYILLKIHKGWFLSTVGDILCVMAVASLLAADLVNRESTSFEVMVGVFPGVALAAAVMVLKPAWVKNGMVHGLSLIPLLPMIFWVEPLLFPTLGLQFVGPDFMALVFGAVLNSGVVVMNMRRCYTAEAWSMNNVADSFGDNIKGFFEWIFRGKFKFSVKTAEEKPIMDRLFEQITTIMRLALQLKGDQTQPLSDDEVLHLVARAIAQIGPDRFESTVERLMVKVLTRKRGAPASNK